MAKAALVNYTELAVLSVSVIIAITELRNISKTRQTELVCKINYYINDKEFILDRIKVMRWFV